MSAELSFKSSPGRRASDVLVTFSAKWRDHLLAGSVRCVFRKKYPKSNVPKRMFIYLAAPHSQVIGFTDIEQLTAIDLARAVSLQEAAQIGDEELRDYFMGYQKIGCYLIGELKLFDGPITLAELKCSWPFHPPQSFVSVSPEAASWFDSKKAIALSSADTRRGVVSVTGGRA